MPKKEFIVDETMSIDDLLTLIEALLKQVRLRLEKRENIPSNS